ncbi:hypothetical protein GRI58_00040 [Porphyrobacter algicida]|uniref:Uncharacterized protein n=1 Tax=Qipengyuania algicida TaxID=1836209 RepID=A0A845AAE0_9SPHN|nr:hypothetical protein [Qipengyuania algicida]MXP27210.1 hypothetical protein [Qipengyuania algicida]
MIGQANRYNAKQESHSDWKSGSTNSFLWRTALAYLAFLSLLALGLGEQVALVPLALFALFAVVGFGMPALKALPLTVGASVERHSRLGTTLQLVFPAIILCWGLIVVTVVVLA